jgi:hypothetical protein
LLVTNYLLFSNNGSYLPIGNAGILCLESVQIHWAPMISPAIAGEIVESSDEPNGSVVSSHVLKPACALPKQLGYIEVANLMAPRSNITLLSCGERTIVQMQSKGSIVTKTDLMPEHLELVIPEVERSFMEQSEVGIS